MRWFQKMYASLLKLSRLLAMLAYEVKPDQLLPMAPLARLKVSRTTDAGKPDAAGVLVGCVGGSGVFVGVAGSGVLVGVGAACCSCRRWQRRIGRRRTRRVSGCRRQRCVGGRWRCGVWSCRWLSAAAACWLVLTWVSGSA